MSTPETMDTIKFFMEDHIISVNSESSVKETIQVMAEKKIGAILVSNDKDYVGIFTETDLLRKVVAVEADTQAVQIKDVMSQPLATIDMNSTMVAAFVIMQQKNLRHLAITDKKQVVGILSIKDIANYYVNKFRPKK
ncbi:MAG: CBS domain-containing protein [Candidatus Nitronauta litoralis]|uniref:CBS domain-containing protein n=1 Tax=Candidatus Nitronauta litoralis TaxID=2705533 RepID=A0A7T0G0K7_9BACT|nr:MAG: CBS domain-containing protein [Candidatus Nitronauta litoralis]